MTKIVTEPPEPGIPYVDIVQTGRFTWDVYLLDSSRYVEASWTIIGHARAQRKAERELRRYVTAKALHAAIHHGGPR